VFKNARNNILSCAHANETIHNKIISKLTFVSISVSNITLRNTHKYVHNRMGPNLVLSSQRH